MEDIRIEIEEDREIRKGGEMLGHHRKFSWDDGRRGESFSPPEGEVPVFARSDGQAEDHFEQFCKQKDIACKRVPTSEERTNDFLFWPSGQKVAAEVKWRKGVVSQRIMAPILVSLATGWTEKYKNL